MDSLIQRLKGFDAYPKTLEDFRVRTFSGATSTCVGVTCACSALPIGGWWRHYAIGVLQCAPTLRTRGALMLLPLIFTVSSNLSGVGAVGEANGRCCTQCIGATNYHACLTLTTHRHSFDCRRLLHYVSFLLRARLLPQHGGKQRAVWPAFMHHCTHPYQ